MSNQKAVREVVGLGRVTVTSTSQSLSDLGVSIPVGAKHISFLNVGGAFIYVGVDSVDTNSYVIPNNYGGITFRIRAFGAGKLRFITGGTGVDMNWQAEGD